jgi:hypothetical protein
MFDPAAMGTLLNGLNADRPEAQHDRGRRAIAPRRERVGIRTAFARGLRRAAALLEGPTVGEVTN